MRHPVSLPIVQQDTTWWRSLEELANAPKFQEALQREFPPQASELPSESRRDFLKLMAASIVLAGGSGCDVRQPLEKIVANQTYPGESTPGIPSYYTTAMDFAGSALGLVVETRDGRPIKVEGNVAHPASLSATTVFAQAATLSLYDPDRAKTPLRRGDIEGIEKVHDTLASIRNRCDQDHGAGLRIVIGASTSPTLQRLLNQITRRWAKAKWLVHEPFGEDAARRGLADVLDNQAVQVSPIYHFDNAKRVLSIDLDFLAARDLPPCYIRQFARARRIVGDGEVERDGKSSIPRLYHLGPTPTVTSSNADHALYAPPSQCVRIVWEIARCVGLTSPQPELHAEQLPQQQQQWVEQVAEDLMHSASESLVVVGGSQAPEVHAMAHAINANLGAIGQTVTFIESPQLRPPDQPQDALMLKQLADECEAGEVDSLLLLGGDPAADVSRDIRFRDAVKRVDFSMALVDIANETSSLCQWTVPRTHFIEAWGDARAFDGTASIVQPMIRPLHQSLSEIELLASLVEDSVSGYEAVRKTWADQLGTAEEDSRWEAALAVGVIPDSSANLLGVSVTPQQKLGRSSLATRTDDQFELVVRPDPTIWDGRFANNGWLQELPKPLTHIVWDNPALIAPDDAARMELSNGDILTIEKVSVENGESSLEIPIWIVPGHASGCVTLFSGYGRTHTGRVGRDHGFDIRPLIGAGWSIADRVQIRKTGRQYPIVTTQHHQTMEGRHLARAGTVDEYIHNSSHPEFAHPPSPAPEASLFPEWSYEGLKWGMSIDLTACVGCSACVIACQSENNIPVVGKQECNMNRHMHWLRVDTYYHGPPQQPIQVLHQPVPCMHCEKAPCEVVCPVAATTHSSEGLNQMIYNRCVGTRYCSNNCPYKVRRFNFLDYSDDFLEEPSLRLLSNPEVTVRSRGVMEKCTYCVQRIERAKIQAELEDRPIRDGEIRTACQSACPAEAIRFGDLNDSGSAVSRAHQHPLSYGLLEELNTKPRTRYLAAVTNPHAETGKDG